MTEEEQIAAAAAQKAADEAAAAKKAADEAEAAKKAADEDEAKKKSSISDAEAKLLKEVMEKKAKIKAADEAIAALNEKLKQFEGIDPVKVRELVKAQQDEETKKLEAKGEWDRLKAQMNEQHQKEIEAIKAQATERSSVVEKLQKQIEELTIGNSFATSKFISDELALTPNKTRVLFGPHFEFKDGAVVGYDKPAGAAERTPLVDGKGEPLPFEAALKKLVESDSEKDSLLRAKVKPGSGSGSTAGTKAGADTSGAAPLKPIDKIAAGLAARMAGK